VGGLAVLAAACSSGVPSADSGSSSPADLSVALGRLVQCMHGHGERGVYS
jgi:hypothetical protein